MAWAEKPLKRNAFNEIVPQYFDEALDDWVPYTGVYGEVTLSGNNVEIVKIFDAVAITTTSTISSNLISLNRYKTGTFVLYHTLGVELELYPQFGSTLNSYILVNGEWVSTQAASITIPPMSVEGRMMLNTHPTYKDVLSSGLHSVRFAVRAKTAPTSGSLTLEYWGSIR